MTVERKANICALLKGIETGDPASVEVVNQDKYIQHNPQTREGGEGLAELFKRLSKTSPRVNIVRIFADGDYVFGHTEYDFSSRRIGFEIFRFEGDQAVEHWDNIQSRQGPNASGHSMVDGPTEVADPAATESSRAVARNFVTDVLINRRADRLDQYVQTDGYTEHNPRLRDGIDALRQALAADAALPERVSDYRQLHRVLAEGDFVLCVSEGSVDGRHASLFDLFRLEQGKIAEHWDTTDLIPPRSEWKNNNGKF